MIAWDYTTAFDAILIGIIVVCIAGIIWDAWHHG